MDFKDWSAKVGKILCRKSEKFADPLDTKRKERNLHSIHKFNLKTKSIYSQN